MIFVLTTVTQWNAQSFCLDYIVSWSSVLFLYTNSVAAVWHTAYNVSCSKNQVLSIYRFQS
jgi:hypothetical protein